MWSVARNLNLSYPAQPESIVEARRTLTEFAAASGADQDQVQAVRLACSEALTNAVLHAYPGQDRPGEVHVTAASVADELWVLIADDGCGLEPQADRPGLGFGLGLITQLSDSVTIVPRAGGGTEVRMRFSLIAAGNDGAPEAGVPATIEREPDSELGGPAQGTRRSAGAAERGRPPIRGADAAPKPTRRRENRAAAGGQERGSLASASSPA